MMKYLIYVVNTPVPTRYRLLPRDNETKQRTYERSTLNSRDFQEHMGDMTNP